MLQKIISQFFRRVFGCSPQLSTYNGWAWRVPRLVCPGTKIAPSTAWWAWLGGPRGGRRPPPHRASWVACGLRRRTCRGWSISRFVPRPGKNIILNPRQLQFHPCIAWSREAGNHRFKGEQCGATHVKHQKKFAKLKISGTVSIKVTWFEKEQLMTKEGCPMAQPRLTRRPEARRMMCLPLESL